MLLISDAVISICHSLIAINAAMDAFYLSTLDRLPFLQAEPIRASTSRQGSTELLLGLKYSSRSMELVESEKIKRWWKESWDPSCTLARTKMDFSSFTGKSKQLQGNGNKLEVWITPQGFP